MQLKLNGLMSKWQDDCWSEASFCPADVDLLGKRSPAEQEKSSGKDIKNIGVLFTLFCPNKEGKAITSLKRKGCNPELLIGTFNSWKDK